MKRTFETSKELVYITKHFIVIECDVEFGMPERRKIEIPKRLAQYINDLESLNKRLIKENGRIK